MSEIKDITDHANFQFSNTASDDLYYSIIDIIAVAAKDGNVSPTEVVGVLEWLKTTLVIQNTEFEEE